MSLSKFQIPSAAAVLSAAASVAAASVVVRSAVPHELQDYLQSQLGRLMAAFSNEFTLVIEEFDGLNPNDLYLAADVYLGSGAAVSASASGTRRFRATKKQAERHITMSMERNEQITDTFHGILLTWRMLCSQIPSKYVSDPDNPCGSTLKTEVRYLELSFHKKHKNKIINEYLPYILEKSKLIKEEKKTLKIFTAKEDRVIGVSGWNPWESVNLDHPATFDTLAMESRLKTEVLEDLERFVKRKEYYRKVGKAWKRGYLLYGPPGTGKSSLIAAMANYLKFNIYDLELTDIRSNSELRNLLVSTANQSILVVEDIDCSIELQDRLAKGNSMKIDHFRQNRGSTVTLSGLLNFIDGLWSSCGDERIIVFTTNHKDRLDPALLRPGRMDMHIHMSYCTPCGFKMLASNYLGIGDHPLFAEIENLIETKTVTPAEVAEQLMKKEGADFALKGLIELLEAKKETEGNEISESESKTKGFPDKQEILQEEVEVITEK